MSDTFPPQGPPQDPPQDFYQYADRAQSALLHMVRSVMREAAEDGLVGEHHFYLTYYTQAVGVEMSDRLRVNHPQEITIVLQNQFEDLHVEEDFFEVTLSFNNQPERLHVPFAALSKFYDPSVAFGLMFDVEDPSESALDDIGDALINDILEAGHEAGADTRPMTAQEEQADLDAAPGGEVVSLDSFRDK